MRPRCLFSGGLRRIAETLGLTRVPKEDTGRTLEGVLAAHAAAKKAKANGECHEQA